jgi:two-component system, sensor histidine kinase PdtaS
VRKRLLAAVACIFVMPFLYAQGGRQSSLYLMRLLAQLKQSKEDTSRVRLLTDCGEYYARLAWIDHRYLDSTKFFLRGADRLVMRFHDEILRNAVNLNLAHLNYLETNDRTAAARFFTYAKLFHAQNDPKHEAVAWRCLWEYTTDVDTVKAFELEIAGHLQTLYTQTGWEDGALWASRCIADVHFREKKYKDAEKEIFDILKRARKGTLIEIDCDALLTGLYISKGVYSTALDYGLRTQKAMDAQGDYFFAPIIHQQLDKIYFVLKEFPQSTYWAKRGVEDLIPAHDTVALLYLTSDVCRSLFAENKAKEALSYLKVIAAKYPQTRPSGRRYVNMLFGHCYLAQKNYNLAEKSFSDMLVGINSPENSPSEKLSYMSAATSFYRHTKQYQKARPIEIEMMKIYEAQGAQDHIMATHLDLFQIDSALGDYPSAIGHLRQSYRIKDSIFDVKKNKQIEELKISYDVAQKEKDLKNLSDNAKLDQARLKQAQTTRNWMIMSSILLLILLAVAISRYQLKRRTNKKLELQQAEIGEQNLALRHLVKEKDWLVKEVHHRVKNNLQIVMSLLNFQSANIEGGPALSAIQESEHRVHAMSLIHQKLYSSENVASIDISLYIRELVVYLGDSFNTGQRIRFDIKVENAELDVSQAVPLGLILNEAITNSIKYAFPDGRKGTITIELSKMALDRYLLCIADNGVGVPGDLSVRKPGSLGMSLMAGLAADLDGTFDIENKNGTSVRITFAHEVTLKQAELENTLNQHR